MPGPQTTPGIGTPMGGPARRLITRAATEHNRRTSRLDDLRSAGHVPSGRIAGIETLHREPVNCVLGLPLRRRDARKAVGTGIFYVSE